MNKEWPVTPRPISVCPTSPVCWDGPLFDRRNFRVDIQLENGVQYRFTWAFRTTLKILLGSCQLYNKINIQHFWTSVQPIKIECTSPNMNALCRWVLHCYRIPCAVSTDDCYMPYYRIGWNITEMRADCLYFTGKRVDLGLRFSRALA